ncbi:MAG TPA: nuclear transport factor 2 family protein [Gemmatimonadaceae bacterium]|nr:nuclear transport factor 2 family protein [Gemmatimonadaceae bacterium]
MTSARCRFIAFLLGAATIAQFACGKDGARPVSEAQRKAIADSLRHLVTNHYDLSKPDVVGRMMSLYPATGPLYSASGGRVFTRRSDLQAQISTFWQYVGSNMQNPKWEWTSMHFDVLAPDAAVMTATYRIPHTTPQGMPHSIGGAWTAVFVNRGGHWVVIQEHLSDVPAAADSMRM